MIAARHRFHGHGSLKYVYSHGRAVRGPLFALKHAPNAKRKSYRLAVVVSKKVDKSAVVRNRIRRRLYEAIRLRESRLTEVHDMVITVFSPSVASMPADALGKALEKLLAQAALI